MTHLVMTGRIKDKRGRRNVNYLGENLKMIGRRKYEDKNGNRERIWDFIRNKWQPISNRSQESKRLRHLKRRVLKLWRDVQLGYAICAGLL